MAGRFFLVSALIAGMVPAAFAQLSNTDKTFVTKVAQANNYEIYAAQLAGSNNTNAAYREYAGMIYEDQVEENGELESTVADQHTTMQLPTGLSPAGEQRLRALKNAGGNLDTVYRNQMIAIHQAVLNLYQNYIMHPDINPGIKDVAQSMLPTLQKHLEAAMELPPAE